jgi:thiol-disulfide isomerase/thioredoxin
MRHLLSLCLACSLSLFAGCDDPPPPNGEGTPKRFAAVKRGGTEKAAKAFCEKSFPPAGENQRVFARPAERPLSVKVEAPAPKDGAWRWINLWATWCKPCVEEMPLLGRWRESLEKDGVALNMELWSLDEEKEDLEGWLKRKVPGEVHWIKDTASRESLLENLGIDKDSAIPVHALVDPRGAIRCVRVGSVRDKDYSAVKTLLTGG